MAFTSPTEHPLELFDFTEFLMSIFQLVGVSLSIIAGVVLTLAVAKAFIRWLAPLR